MMAEVINFPMHKVKQRSANTNADLELVFEQKKILIDDLVDHYASNLINKCSMHGFDVDDRDFMYDFAFMVEAFRSALYRDVGIRHPIQEISDGARGMYEEDIEDFFNNNDDDPDLA